MMYECMDGVFLCVCMNVCMYVCLCVCRYDVRMYGLCMPVCMYERM